MAAASYRSYERLGAMKATRSLHHDSPRSPSPRTATPPPAAHNEDSPSLPRTPSSVDKLRDIVRSEIASPPSPPGVGYRAHFSSPRSESNLRQPNRHDLELPPENTPPSSPQSYVNVRQFQDPRSSPLRTYSASGDRRQTSSDSGTSVRQTSAATDERPQMHTNGVQSGLHSRKDEFQEADSSQNLPSSPLKQRSYGGQKLRNPPTPEQKQGVDRAQSQGVDRQPEELPSSSTREQVSSSQSQLSHSESGTHTPRRSRRSSNRATRHSKLVEKWQHALEEEKRRAEQRKQDIRHDRIGGAIDQLQQIRVKDRRPTVPAGQTSRRDTTDSTTDGTLPDSDKSDEDVVYVHETSIYANVSQGEDKTDGEHETEGLSGNELGPPVSTAGTRDTSVSGNISSGASSPVTSNISQGRDSIARETAGHNEVSQTQLLPPEKETTEETPRTGQPPGESAILQLERSLLEHHTVPGVGDDNNSYPEDYEYYTGYSMSPATESETLTFGQQDSPFGFEMAATEPAAYSAPSHEESMPPHAAQSDREILAQEMTSPTITAVANSEEDESEEPLDDEVFATYAIQPRASQSKQSATADESDSSDGSMEDETVAKYGVLSPAQLQLLHKTLLPGSGSPHSGSPHSPQKQRPSAEDRRAAQRREHQIKAMLFNSPRRGSPSSPSSPASRRIGDAERPARMPFSEIEASRRRQHSSFDTADTAKGKAVTFDSRPPAEGSAPSTTGHGYGVDEGSGSIPSVRGSADHGERRRSSIGMFLPSFISQNTNNQDDWGEFDLDDLMED
eukprot:gb/GECG01015323.1/.p1 GENE.gb/GECG01015323.1/~~gb/GECG01015323.1/.p1  ORF type:complete len:789 (+),score=115.70 gb/GECG01015323.1/:1-2367(+)